MAITTNPTGSKTTPHGLSPEDVAEAFLELFERELMQDNPSAVLDALPRTVEALAPVAPAARCERFASGVTRAVERYTQRRRTEPDSARAEVLGRLPRLCADVDRALLRFDQQAELDDAQAEVAELDRRYREALNALQQAVAAADVPEVMRLRGDVEVGLPGRLGTARLRLLDLQIAEAEAQQAFAPRRTQAFAEAVRLAKEHLSEAERRADRARGDLHAAQTRRDTASLLGTDMSANLAALRDEREALADRHEQDQHRRLLRLAGLPDAEAVA